MRRALLNGASSGRVPSAAVNGLLCMVAVTVAAHAARLDYSGICYEVIVAAVPVLAP